MESVNADEAAFHVQLTLPDGSKLPALADGEYDAIILGTGLKECIISGILTFVFCMCESF